jgi:translation elongation factor EF-G
MRYVMNNEPYCLNLIDTPGHVDFSYEVCSRLFIPLSDREVLLLPGGNDDCFPLIANWRFNSSKILRPFGVYVVVLW